METPSQTPPKPEDKADKDKTTSPTPPAPPTSPPSPSPAKPNEIDPLVLEYADTLKATLGELYKPEWDNIAVKERIERMKIVKDVMEAYPKRSEGKPPAGVTPEPKDTTPKVKNHWDRWNSGESGINTSANAFEFTLNKNH